MGDFDGEQKELIKKLVNFRVIMVKERKFMLLYIKNFTA
jgi:hypothetical protein